MTSTSDGRISRTWQEKEEVKIKQADTTGWTTAERTDRIGPEGDINRLQ